MGTIAYFISPHGFGHAARACAVIQALSDLDPSLHFEIFTSVPHWFFVESLTCSFSIYNETVDIGLVQSTPLDADLDATIQALNNLYPVNELVLDRWARRIVNLNCKLVICDISPFGILVAKKSGIPSILIENFTWDWIYETYLDEKPEFRQFILIMRELYKSCDFHIQTEPLCLRNTKSSILVPPISRIYRTPSSDIREGLGIRSGYKMVLLTMGGIESDMVTIAKQLALKSTVLVIPGAGRDMIRRDNLVLLPYHSSFYHPDLMNACDAVIGKAGYSTIAEAYYAGIPFGYISRDHFRESPVLEKFISNNFRSICLTSEDLFTPRLKSIIDYLLSFNKIEPLYQNGSGRVSRYISDIFKAL